jgi:starvation-inducible DNA-binding protein
MQMALKRTSIRGPDSETAAQYLQETLADLIDLTLQAKQAHWNVVGRGFRGLHLQLDDVVAHTRAYADTVAERIVTLGQPAQGSLVQTEMQSKLDPLPTGFIRDDEVVELFVERLEIVCGRMRQHLAFVGETDSVSQELLVKILGTLEKQMWMFHAQAQ